MAVISNQLQQNIPLQENPQKKYNQFWGLQEYYWQQYVDGIFHGYGPFVFDEGLHGGAVEPGYLKSLRKACVYVSHCFDIKNLSIPFYKEIHRIACSHFKGTEEDQTNMCGKLAGHFYRAQAAQFTTARFFQSVLGEDWVSIERFRIHLQFLKKYTPIVEEIKENNLPAFVTPVPTDKLLPKRVVSLDELQDLLKDSNAICSLILNKIEKRIEFFNQYIAEKTKNYAGISFAKIEIIPNHPLMLKMVYLCPREKVSKVVETLFTNFNEEIKKATEYKAKIRLIADLYQKLEWLHPFPDGQGRTDLLLLSFVLCQQDFHPTILYHPYTSSISTLEYWSEYLESGLNTWENFQRNLHKHRQRKKYF